MRREKGLQATERSISRMVIGGGQARFNKSWRTFKQNGSKFTSIGVSPVGGFFHRLFYGSRKPVRTLVLLGRNDPSYSPDYIDYIEKIFSPFSFAKINIYDFPEETAHDLWRRDKTQFKQVVGDMARFILSEE